MGSFLQAFGDCAFYWESPVCAHTGSIGGSPFSSLSPAFIACSLLRMPNLTGKI